MKGNLVFAFTGDGANDAIRGIMREYADALASVGLSVVEVSQEPAELQYVVEQMVAGNVAFGLGWLGFGQNFTVIDQATSQEKNAWEACGVPLLKLHGDLPAYFPNYHRDVPRTAVNLYHAEEFARFWRKWLPHERALTVQIPPLPLSPVERSSVDLSRRRAGTLFFLKNGNSSKQLRSLWRQQLSPAVADTAEKLAEAIAPIGLRPGKLFIGEFVADFLNTEFSIEPESLGDLLLFFSAQMDDYLRRLKSEMIARSLLDLPVVVQGDFWDHVDFTGRKARRVDGIDYAATQRIYAEQLGIIDMSPNVDTWPHDRVQRAAGTYATVLTNRQSWISELFPDFEQLTFEFTPDSIQARVADALANPARYLELGMAFGDRFREHYTREAFARRLVSAAALASLQWTPDKPSIQPFVVWPRTSIKYPAP